MTAGVTRWSVVVPVKAWRSAKSRLSHLDTDERAELGQCLARDTVERVLDTVGVLECLLVGASDTCADMATSGARGVEIPDKLGLNAALLHGQASAHRNATGVCLLVADLPLLSSEGLQAALAMVPAQGPAIVRDRSGTGTTMLASRGSYLQPSFGSGSAVRHLAARSADLSGVVDTGLRRDLDDWADLADLIPVPGSRVAAWRHRVCSDHEWPVPHGASPLSLIG